MSCNKRRADCGYETDCESDIWKFFKETFTRNIFPPGWSHAGVSIRRNIIVPIQQVHVCRNLFCANYQFGFERVCVLLGDAYLALSSWPELYIYSLKTERLIWAYDLPSQVTGLVYDPLHQQLINSHTDGVTRRWELPTWTKGSETQ